MAEEFEALWGSPLAVPLAEAVGQDIGRLAGRRVLHRLADWMPPDDGGPPDPAPALVETPVFRREVGLWEHQKYFVKTVLDWHHGPLGKARFVLADQVGLGKTLQLGMAAQLIALSGERPVLVICPKTLVWQWHLTAQRMLGSWENMEGVQDDEDDEDELIEVEERAVGNAARTLRPQERGQLERFVAALEANRERDPKVAAVLRALAE